MGEKVLTIRNLMFSYGHIQALSGIAFDVEDREIVTLIGNNGSGKSTGAMLGVSALAGLLRSEPDAGVRGAAVTRIGARGAEAVPLCRRLAFERGAPEAGVPLAALTLAGPAGR